MVCRAELDITFTKLSKRYALLSFSRYDLQHQAWGVRFAQVKEEPAKRAGDTEQNVRPAPDACNEQSATSNENTNKRAYKRSVSNRRTLQNRTVKIPT
jgi:hypothetical protein